MTLAKTFHASNMMQDFVKPTHIAARAKAVWIVPFLFWKKIKSHLGLICSVFINRLNTKINKMLYIFTYSVLQ